MDATWKKIAMERLAASVRRAVNLSVGAEKACSISYNVVPTDRDTCPAVRLVLGRGISEDEMRLARLQAELHDPDYGLDASWVNTSEVVVMLRKASCSCDRKGGTSYHRTA